MMIKLYDEDLKGYIEAEVSEFYCNDYPQYFARIDKGSYVRWIAEPIYTVPAMIWGSQPRDGGNLIIEADEYDDFIAREPKAKKWIRPYVGAREFLHNLPRYCLWLVDCPPNELKKMPLVYKRVEAVREFRLASKAEPTRKFAATPWLFCQIAQPNTNYLIVPQVSSERREYIPIGYMDANTIASNLVLMVPDAMFWHFGVLTSLPHMAWMRMVAGRMRNDYRYSIDVVYNNFPWPPFNREVERTAAKILSARRNYPEASLADLYDPLIMPKDLRQAHEENDRAVMEAYDFHKGMTEAQMQVAFLKMYEHLKNFDEFYRSL